MRSPDIGSLVTGILAVIGIALALGQYGRLEAWARNRALEAMQWKRGLPYFFADPGQATKKAVRRSQTQGRRTSTAPSPGL